MKMVIAIIKPFQLDELREALTGPFNIRLPDDPELDGQLQRLVNIRT